MPLSEFRGEEVGEFDLANFTFNFVIGHLGIEIMFKPILAQQLDKQFLRKIRVSGGAPSSTSRPALREALTRGWWETMRCSSDHRRLTSEQRRLSTHLPLFAIRSAVRLLRAD